MRVAVLSDAHGNAFGLKTCLESIAQERVEQVYYLGDSFGYGSDGERVVELLRGVNAHALLGNHDAMLLGLLPLDEQRNLSYRLPPLGDVSAASVAWLQALLPYAQESVAGCRLLFVHGSPFDPLCGYLYADGDKRALANLPFDCVFMGHTHRPYLEKVGQVCVANVGSCGLPRDIGNRLSYAIYDSEQNLVELRYCTVDPARMKDSFANASDDVLQCLERRK